MKLYNKDCLEFLSTLDDSSIDMVLTDPPYFEIVKNDWDNQWETEQEYLAWCKCWTDECVRVLKPNRMLAVWGTTKTDTFLRYKLDVMNSNTALTYRNWIIWHYDWGGRPKNNFARKHEDCLVYSKGNEWYFDDAAIRIPYKVEKNVRSTATNNPLGKIPTDVWEKNNHTTSKEYVAWHPTQKPLMILERLIRAYTKPGDTILDIFSGSGSTMIAAHNTGRKFVGCELSSEYYDKSKKRFEDFCNVSLDTADSMGDIFSFSA